MVRSSSSGSPLVTPVAITSVNDPQLSLRFPSGCSRKLAVLILQGLSDREALEAAGKEMKVSSWDVWKIRRNLQGLCAYRSCKRPFESSGLCRICLEHRRSTCRKTRSRRVGATSHPEAVSSELHVRFRSQADQEEADRRAEELRAEQIRSARRGRALRESGSPVPAPVRGRDALLSSRQRTEALRRLRSGSLRFPS